MNNNPMSKKKQNKIPQDALNHLKAFVKAKFGAHENPSLSGDEEVREIEAFIKSLTETDKFYLKKLASLRKLSKDESDMYFAE